MFSCSVLCVREEGAGCGGRERWGERLVVPLQPHKVPAEAPEMCWGFLWSLACSSPMATSLLCCLRCPPVKAGLVPVLAPAELQCSCTDPGAAGSSHPRWDWRLFHNQRLPELRVAARGDSVLWEQ